MSKYNIDNLYYNDSEHKKRLLELLLKDNTNIEDLERLSLFYLASSDLDICNKFSNYLYDFKEHWIELEGLTRVNLSSSQRKLIYLGFNLYNNFHEEGMTVLNLFSGLDDDNIKVVIESIKIRLCH